MYTIHTERKYNRAQTQKFLVTTSVKRDSERFAKALFNTGAWSAVKVTNPEGATILSLH